jgi:DNA-binding transcriptional MerR regulator
MNERRVYINEAAERLDRRIDTLRKWDSSGVLPEGLRPFRGERRWRYWTEDQMSLLEEWAATRIPGSALAGYDPDQERLSLHRRNMRRPKNRKEPA